ncbi:MAG TPA: hypothetical protein VK590_15880 [Saprospiraceae bacterium]|nr:hypothetical protein [Saprospiraceae bacterium]
MANKNNWQSFENSSKSELEEIKLKTEIINLRKEIDKSWFSKNLAILIPSFIGFATILSAYLTGFFDVESKLLEIKKENLKKEIYNFEEKKDSLNIENLKLRDNNYFLINKEKSLNIERNKLINDVFEKNNHLAFLNKNLNQLNKKVKKSYEDLSKAGFNLVWDKFKINHDFQIYAYPLFEAIKQSKSELRSGYIKTIQNSIDSTKDLNFKAQLQLIMYSISENRKWVNQLFETGDLVCKNIKANKYSNYKFYYQVLFNYGLDRAFMPFEKLNSIEDKIILEKKLISYIKEIQAHSSDVSSIMDIISATLQNEYYNEGNLNALISELIKPEILCLILSESSKMTYYDEESLRSSNKILIEYIAPVAAVCHLTQLLSDSNFNDMVDQDGAFITDLNRRVRLLIQKNSGAFSQAPVSPSQSNWIDWKNQNQNILNYYKNISINCDEDRIKQLRGNGSFTGNSKPQNKM